MQIEIVQRWCDVPNRSLARSADGLWIVRSGDWFDVVKGYGRTELQGGFSAPRWWPKCVTCVNGEADQQAAENVAGWTRPIAIVGRDARFDVDTFAQLEREWIAQVIRKAYA